MNSCKIEVLVDCASTGVRLLLNRTQYDELMAKFGWADSHAATMLLEIEGDELIIFDPVKRDTHNSLEALQALASNTKSNANNKINQSTDAPSATITPPNKTRPVARKAQAS